MKVSVKKVITSEDTKTEIEFQDDKEFPNVKDLQEYLKGLEKGSHKTILTKFLDGGGIFGFIGIGRSKR